MIWKFDLLCDFIAYVVSCLFGIFSFISLFLLLIPSWFSVRSTALLCQPIYSVTQHTAFMNFDDALGGAPVPPSHHIPPFICSIYECNTHLLCQNASSVSSNKTRNIRTAALHIWHIHRCFRFVEFEICIEQHFIWMEIFIIFHRKYIIICILPFSSSLRSFRIRAAAACYCYCHLLAWCFLRIRCNCGGERILCDTQSNRNVHKYWQK